MMKDKIKLTDATEKFLTSKKGYKKSWVRTFLAIIFSSIIYGVVLGYAYNVGPFSEITYKNDLHDIAYRMAQHADLMKTATYLCYAGIAIYCAPFISGVATWLIGINQVSKSKYFHLFMWFMVMVSAMLAIIAMVLLIRSTIYYPTGMEAPQTEQHESLEMLMML